LEPTRSVLDQGLNRTEVAPLAIIRLDTTRKRWIISIQPSQRFGKNVDLSDFLEEILFNFFFDAYAVAYSLANFVYSLTFVPTTNV
jgi:hypothetical protein